MKLKNALTCAYVFDGSGRAERADDARLDLPVAEAEWTWVHLDRTHDATEQWLRTVANLDPLAVEALLEEETRPRSVHLGDGLIVILRGVNLNAGADPEDMISIRLWIESKRVVTLHNRRIMAIHDLRDSIERGDAPATPGALLVETAGYLIDRMGPVIDEIHDAVDQIEEDVLDAPSNELRSRLSRLRRKAISLRRFLAPQREAFTRLHSDRSPTFTELDRSRLREIADRLTRYVEELDAARDRAAVTQEELVGRISDQMNRNMYVLSIVAGIFLPLGLLTGLLGINVGGMPGVENPWAFSIVCVVLLGTAWGVIWLFRRMRLL